MKPGDADFKNIEVLCNENCIYKINSTKPD